MARPKRFTIRRMIRLADHTDAKLVRVAGRKKVKVAVLIRKLIEEGLKNE